MLRTVAVHYGNVHGNIQYPNRQDYRLLELLLVAGVEQGVWLHEQFEGREGCRPDWRPARLTALQIVIRSAWERCRLDARGEAKVVQSLREFVTALSTAGVDLAAYGAYETELGSVHHVGYDTGGIDVDRTLYGFAYGSRPSDWSVLIEHPGDQFAGIFWDAVEHPERLMPGAWSEEPSLCWEDSYFDDIRREKALQRTLLLISYGYDYD